MIRLINDILDIEKIESGKLVFTLQPIALLPLVAQAIEANCAYGAPFNCGRFARVAHAHAGLSIEYIKLVCSITFPRST